MKRFLFSVLSVWLAALTVFGQFRPPATGGGGPTNGVTEAQATSIANARVAANAPPLIRDAQGNDLVPRFGEEYLADRWWAVCNGFTAVPRLGLLGDSLTAGSGISDSFDNYPHKFLQRALWNVSARGVAITNAGVSGTAAVNVATNGSLAAVLAWQPDALVIKLGANDAGFGITAYSNAMRSILSEIRHTNGLTQTNVSLVLVSSSHMNDTPNGRDRAWFDAQSLVLRALAREFRCVFMDSGRSALDVANLVSAMDDPYGDGRHIHPRDALARRIWGEVADVLQPRGFDRPINPWGYQIPNVSTTNLPAWFPRGESWHRAFSTNWGGLDGGVKTELVNSDGVWLQQLVSYTEPIVRFRTGSSTAWNSPLLTVPSEEFYNPGYATRTLTPTNLPAWFNDWLVSGFRTTPADSNRFNGGTFTFSQNDGMQLQAEFQYADKGRIRMRTGGGTAWNRYYHVDGAWNPFSTEQVVFATNPPSIFTNAPMEHYRVTSTNGFPFPGALLIRQQADGVWEQKLVPDVGTATNALERYSQGSTNWTAWVVIGGSSGGGGGSARLVAISVGTSSFNPGDGDTRYFGGVDSVAPTSTEFSGSRVYVTHSGTIKAASLQFNNSGGANGTSEAWPIYVRHNGTTDYLIENFDVTASDSRVDNSSLSIAVSAGDYVMIKMVNPTWATNPTSVRFGGYLVLEVP